MALCLILVRGLWVSAAARSHSLPAFRRAVRAELTSYVNRVQQRIKLWKLQTVIGIFEFLCSSLTCPDSDYLQRPTDTHVMFFNEALGAVISSMLELLIIGFIYSPFRDACQRFMLITGTLLFIFGLHDIIIVVGELRAVPPHALWVLFEPTSSGLCFLHARTSGNPHVCHFERPFQHRIYTSQPSYFPLQLKLSSQRCEQLPQCI